MANPTYILVNQDSSLDQSRYLRSNAPVSNIQLNDNGADAPLDITTIFNLGNLAAFNTLGLVAYTDTHTFSARAITSSNTINITNPSGTVGNVILDVIDGSSVQKVDIAVNSVSTTIPQRTINFIPGHGIGISATDGINSTDITINATVGIGTVTDVTAASTTGLTVNVTNPTTTPNIAVDLPSGGIIGQILTVSSINPQTVHWATPTYGGTVTSIGIASNTGLDISGSPVTLSGVIDVNLPVGNPGQVLAIDTSGPQTLHWVDAAIGSVTSVGLTSTSGLSITGSPITTSGNLTIDLPTGLAGQVLAIDTSGPQTLHWISVGTVTSVGASSSTGLTIGGSPITSSGAFTIDLPSGGVVGEVLAVASTGPQTLHWVSPPPGTVTSVSGSSTSGVTVNVTNPTTTPNIAVDLPIGSTGQVLSVASTGPQTLHWTTPTSGTVTSVGVSSSTGLTIGSTPVTSSGTITVDLPSGGAVGQLLNVTGIGPQTVGWTTSLIRVSNNVLSAGDSITFPSSSTTNPNMLIGRTLGKTNFTGGFDVLVGIDILTTASASSGSNNSALGYQALHSFTSGGNNTAVGYQAAKELTTATSTTAVGAGAGALITTQNNNTVIGAGAMSVGTTEDNTVVGSGAYGSATSVGIGQNTIIGHNAGTLQTSYDTCTFLGYAADATATALANASAIGANAQVTTSHSMVLGADINVGIGTASPAYGIHLGANGTYFKPAIHFTGTTTPTTPSAGNTVLWAASSGNTGSLNVVSGNARYTGMVPTVNTGGSAPTAGTVTLNGTTPVTVTTSAVKTGSIIMLTHTNAGSGGPGVPILNSITNGVSFTVKSSAGSDLRVIQWWIVD